MFRPNPLPMPKLPKHKSPIIKSKMPRTKASMMDRLLKVGIGVGAVLPGFYVGQYMGDGNATQAIVGVGFQPNLLLIYPNAHPVSGAGMKSDQDGANYMGWQYTGASSDYRYTTDNVNSLDVDGFTVGDGTTLGSNWMNVAARVYSFACWGTGVYQLATGTYTGDNNATQIITGIGFSPKLLFLYNKGIAIGGVANNPIALKCYLDGTKTLYYRQSTSSWRWLDDLIPSLDADGFTVGDGTGEGNVFNSAVAHDYMYEAWA